MTMENPVSDNGLEKYQLLQPTCTKCGGIPDVNDTFVSNKAVFILLYCPWCIREEIREYKFQKVDKVFCRGTKKALEE